MFKRIMFLLLWLGGGIAFGQTINNVAPSSIGVDGTNNTGDKVITLPQVQTTPLGTPTPQTSSWFQLNGNAAMMVEFSANTFAGSYSVQVSDNPTPVSTPGVGYYTVTQDDATYGSGGQGAQTKNWAYLISEGWKWVRFLCTPETGNTGTLNIQARLFGSGNANATGAVGANAVRSYQSGVPWRSVDQLVNSLGFAAATNYYDYKLPYNAGGFNLYTNILGKSGTVTLAPTVYFKDPVSGLLQSIGVSPIGTAAAVTGLSTMVLTTAYTAPYPVATPPAGTCFIGVNPVQDVVIGDVITGTGSVTFSQDCSPIKY